MFIKMLNLFIIVYIQLILIPCIYNVFCTAHFPHYSVVFSDVTIYVYLHLKVNSMIALICRAIICVLKLYQYPNG